ncbi:MAG: hypothetical protein ACK5LC_09965 [Coprobacillaceae bacterium]
MIIKDKEIVKILQYACNEFFDFKDILISDMNVEVGDHITAIGRVSYYGVETKVKVVAKIECQPTKIIIYTKGVIKYGIINLDFNKLMKEYLKDNDYLHVSENGLMIKNDYIKTITYGDGQIEIELT